MNTLYLMSTYNYSEIRSQQIGHCEKKEKKKIINNN